MANDIKYNAEEVELRAAIETILRTPGDKKLVISGPGTGKTTLFKQLLELAPGRPERNIVLTFINNLRDDLEDELRGLAQVFTLHAYCLGLLYRNPAIRGALSSNFRCCPGLASLISEDWKLVMESDAPQFVGQMRTLTKDNQIPFYLRRGEYYNAVDFDDSVYRVYEGLSSGLATPESYNLILVDEYQDFNSLEAGIIDVLAEHSPILIAGDDDQALYSQLRYASWDHIRLLSKAQEYKVFKLPFCLRCPKVVVDAVNDVLTKASTLDKLKGRISKPFKYFPLTKGADSTRYPTIADVETSVQKQNANYMGRYIADSIAGIPADEIESATHSGYPAALVIVAQPYRDQIVSYLDGAGHFTRSRSDFGSKLNREVGLSILKEDQDSNLGWRIVLAADIPSFIKDVVVASTEGKIRLVDELRSEYRERVLADVEKYKPLEETEAEVETTTATEAPIVMVTSFEGAKGLSAQYVYIAGLHNGELPHDPVSIKDLEICKFVVGLTRTRKKCTLMHTQNFAGNRKTPSSFISWIDPARLEFIKVDAKYWR